MHLEKIKSFYISTLMGVIFWPICLKLLFKTFSYENKFNLSIWQYHIIIILINIMFKNIFIFFKIFKSTMNYLKQYIIILNELFKAIIRSRRHMLKLSQKKLLKSNKIHYKETLSFLNPKKKKKSYWLG